MKSTSVLLQTLIGVFYLLTIVTAYVNMEDGLIAHEPIYIDGDENFIYENGVTAGSGTFYDPYIIENWKVNASESKHSGIFIINTRAHFIVRNVLIYDGMKIGYKEGITLLNVSNGVIESIQSINNNCGISLYAGSSNITITENRILDNHEGINLDFSFSNRITLNFVFSNKYGITLDSSHDNSIFGNNITNNIEGISLSNSSNNIIRENNIANGFLHGVGLEFSDDNNIANNNITSIYYWGIELHYSDSNTIAENNLVDTINGSSILLGDSRTNKIYHNNFINNSIRQAYVYSSYKTVWDDGYPSGGNYWSDYTIRYPNAQELDDSGIWDTPYVIDWNNQDNYPLVEPWTPLPRTIGELKTKVEELGSESEIDKQGIVKSLIAKLNVAQKMVDKGKIDEAKIILADAFIPQVQNLSGFHITPEAADILIQSAEYILSHL